MANEDKRTKAQRETENNANNIRNAADVAIATKNPYAVAAGTAVKAADKLTGGRSTQALGRAMTTANKFSPGGRKIQGLSNRLSESGASDKIGKVAAAKNGMAGSGAAANGTNAANTTKAQNTASSATSQGSKGTSSKWSDFLGGDDNRKSSSDSSDSFIKKRWQKLPLKTKLIIIGVAAGAFFFFMIFFAVISTIGAAFKGNSSNKSVTVSDSSIVVVDKDGNSVDIPDGANPGVYDASYYSLVGENTIFWWPIGSENVDGGFASGDPISTVITSEFGNRVDPFTNETKYHSGIDIAPVGSSNVNIIAVSSGEVLYPDNNSVINCPSSSTESDCGGGYGNYVMIKHDNGIITLYGHLYENSITVRKGDTVSQGQVIAKMGSSGRSTGTHLHFEVRVNGQRVNPIGFVSANNPRPSGYYGITTGNDNVQTICLSLKQNNFSDAAIAGILGNMERESNYDPNATNNLGCVGLVQWCSGRANNLKNTYGGNWNNINNQLEFMLSELNGNESSVLTYLNDPSITSAGLMAGKFCTIYERPEEDECENGTRQSFAENKYSYVQNGCQ